MVRYSYVKDKREDAQKGWSQSKECREIVQDRWENKTNLSIVDYTSDNASSHGFSI